MKTVSAQRLFEGINEVFTGNSQLPDTRDWPSVRGHLDLALAEVWHYESWEQTWWPFLMTTERRYFRDNWLAGSTYDKTDEVFDAATQQYFQCLRDSVSGAGQSPTDSAGAERSDYWALSRAVYSGNNWASGTSYAVGAIVFYAVDNNYYQCHTAHTSSGTLVPDATGGNERWGVLTPFLRYVDKLATGQTEIGDTYNATDVDPRANPGWTQLDWEELADRVYVRDAVASAWLTFRKARPVLSGAIFDATDTYAAGDQVYYASATAAGNFYDCLSATSAGETPESAAAKWQVVELPAAFEGFLIWSALAGLYAADENDPARLHANASAEGHLIQQANRCFPYRGRGSRTAPRVYAASVT